MRGIAPGVDQVKFCILIWNLFFILLVCGDCPKILGNVTQVLTKAGLGFWNKTQKVGLVQEQDIIVISLQQQINETNEILGVSNKRLGVLETMSTGLSSNKTKIFDGFVSALLTQVCHSISNCSPIRNIILIEIIKFYFVTVGSHIAF